jgi:hypothetical protein
LITIRFTGGPALREELAQVIDEFFKRNAVSDSEVQDAELEPDDESQIPLVGLSNNELTWGPLD